MGRLTRLLAFIRGERAGVKLSDVQVSPGNGANITAEHFSSPGDDSYPLPNDYVALNTDEGTGRETAIGYLDPANAQLAAPGEKRIYSRSTAGQAVAHVHLFNDGRAVMYNDAASVTIQPDGAIIVINSNGSITLQAGGDVNINGVVINAAGEVTIPSSLTLNGKEIAEHTHGGIEPGGGTSGVNN